MERGRDARNTMQSLQNCRISWRAARTPQGDGADQRRHRLNIYNLFDNNSVASDIIDATRNAIAAATRANVSIYAIDPRGWSRRVPI